MRAPYYSHTQQYPPHSQETNRNLVIATNAEQTQRNAEHYKMNAEQLQRDLDAALIPTPSQQLSPTTKMKQQK